jgi:glucose-1-phosphate cytidylyltransferase
MRHKSMELHHKHAEHWRGTIVETGDHTMIGGRLNRVASYIGAETFCFTYGDGLGDIDTSASLQHHRQHKRFDAVLKISFGKKF